MSSIRYAIIAASLLSLAACGNNYGSGPATTPTPAPMPGAPGTTDTSASVSIPSGAATLGNQAFPPNPLTVDPGTTVTWKNTDAVAHTSTSDVAGWDSGIIAPGAQYSTALTTSGTYHYHCQIHPGMVGTIVVR
jgi:plastocyanin